MNVEVKITLESANDYYVVTNALDNRRLGEETYRDCFFDFPNGALAEMTSLLRLRTPCLKPGEEASPLLASAAGGAFQVVPGATAGHSHAGNAGESGAPSIVGLTAGSFEEFLQSAPGPSAVDEERRIDEARSAFLSLGGSSSGTAQTALLAAACPTQDVVLLPDQTGKLVLKQRNTVERGQQMSFVMEDNAVPAPVVAAMVQGTENPFDVLCRYAEATPPGSKVRDMVHQLRAVAQTRQERDDDEQGTARAAGSGASGENPDANTYENIRYSAVTATPPRSQGSRQREIDALSCTLVSTGSYITTRTTYRYLCTGAAQLNQNMTTEERNMWENLRLRLDATSYPFGEQFEVEIPKIPDAFLDDVSREVFSFLRHLNVRFHPASEGKYARFIQGVRSLHARREETQDIKIRLTSVNGYNEVKQNLESIAEPAGGVVDDQRRITNLDVDRVYREASGARRDVIEEEQQDNCFFDGPNGELRQQNCFLRLRRVNGGAKYVLVLKEKQAFVGGQQDTITQKTALSGDIAETLVVNPSAFLEHHHESNAIAGTLWSHFQLRQLTGVAHFSTRRLKVPWRAAHSQKYVPERSSTQMLTGGPAPPTNVVPPLVIHLDRTQFELPRAAVGVPGFTQHVQADFQTGQRTYEMYEVEVTNLIPTTSPSQVLQELTDALDWMGVEWQYGTQSKLDQFYTLLDSSVASANAGTTGASTLFDRWGMQRR